MDQKATWIVVPTLNEAGNIPELLQRIRAAMSGEHYSVCVVDDGSRDGTLDRVRAFSQAQADKIHIIQRKKTHLGSQRGVAVWTGLQYGFRHSQSDVFVEMDADLSHRPEELKAGLSLLREAGYNVAIAAKYLPGSKVVNRPVGRRVLSRVANTMVRSLITQRISDYSNGYRFYDRECVSMICNHRLRYGSPIYLSEVLALLLAHRMRVCEFPSTYVGRGEGLSKLRPIDLLKAGIAVMHIAARYHFHMHGFARGTPIYAPVQISQVEPELKLESQAK